MTRKQITDEYTKMINSGIKPGAIFFAIHIAKQTRINTLQEVKDALNKLQDKTK